jgi:hypothetical protein
MTNYEQIEDELLQKKEQVQHPNFPEIERSELLSPPEYCMGTVSSRRCSRCGCN